MARILIINRNHNSRIALKDLLEAEGHEVVDAAGGIEGCWKNRKCHCDIILLDVIFLPGRGGFETLNGILKEDPAAKIIDISGEDKMPFLARDVYSKMNGVGTFLALTRPFSRCDITEAIRTVLDATPEIS